MKRILIAAIALILLVLLSFAHTAHLTSFTQDLSDLLQEAQRKTEAGDWAAAKNITQRAEELWLSEEEYLHITLHHKDTDAVLVSFGEVLAYLDGEEKQPAEYAAANQRLIQQLNLLSEAEQPTWKNLL